MLEVVSLGTPVVAPRLHGRRVCVPRGLRARSDARLQPGRLLARHGGPGRALGRARRRARGRMPAVHRRGPRPGARPQRACLRSARAPPRAHRALRLPRRLAARGGVAAFRNRLGRVPLPELVSFRHSRARTRRVEGSPPERAAGPAAQEEVVGASRCRDPGALRGRPHRPGHRARGLADRGRVPRCPRRRRWRRRAGRARRGWGRGPGVRHHDRCHQPGDGDRRGALAHRAAQRGAQAGPRGRAGRVDRARSGLRRGARRDHRGQRDDPALLAPPGRPLRPARAPVPRPEEPDHGRDA